MTGFTGTATLLRLALRRDRVKLPAWLLAIAGMSAYFANALRAAYPTQADLEAIMGFMSGPAGVVMSGPGYGFDEPTHPIVFAGGYGLYLLVAAAFMGILLVARHTRAEEEAGRLELVRAGVVGRHAPLAVAGLLAVLANVVLALLTWALLASSGYDSGGAALFGAGLGTVGLVFAGVALVTAQLAEHSRSATGLAALVLGAAIVVRGAGDVLQEHGSPLSWLSPIAWAQQTRVFYDDRWWPLALGVALAALCFAAGYALQARRDLGAGLLATRPGRPHASGALGTPLGLFLRLERGAIVGWSLALLASGFLYGALTDSVESSLAGLDNEILVQAMGGDPTRLVDGYLATSALFDAFLAVCFAITAMHRLVREERDIRTEVVLAGAVSRATWVTAALATSLAGATVVLVAAGLGMGTGAAAVTGDGGYVVSGLGSHLVYWPAVALVTAIAAAGYAARPRLLNLAWVVAAYTLLIGYIGALLDLPQAVLNLSPFEHVAQVPLEAVAVTPLVGLVVLAGLVAAAALAVFRRRDLVTG